MERFNIIYQDIGALSGLEKLTELKLNRNAISMIPESFKFCVNLNILDVGNNQIKEFKYDSYYLLM